MDWRNFFKWNVPKAITTVFITCLSFFFGLAFSFVGAVTLISILFSPFDLLRKGLYSIIFKHFPESVFMIFSIAYWIVALIIMVVFFYSLSCFIYYFTNKLKNKIIRKVLLLFLFPLFIAIILFFPIWVPSHITPMDELIIDEPQPPIPTSSYRVTLSRSTIVETGNSRVLKVSVYNPNKEEIKFQPNMVCSKDQIVRIKTEKINEGTEISSIIAILDLSKLKKENTYMCTLVMNIGLNKYSNDLAIIKK